MATNGQVSGRKRGPRFKINPEQALQVKKAHEQNIVTVDEIARRFGVTRQTIYNVLKRLRTEESR
jgi:DNA invertase Pin-like site-specific DNA recombinase